MSTGAVTVAIPVLNGERYLGEVLAAVRAQVIERELDLLVVDSGSRDRSLEIARAAGARVVEVPQHEFSHGGTRNLLMELAHGDHVAFLTQDATPATELWLQKLLAGFRLADDVALVFGPYRPRASASVMVRRELEDYFHGFAPDGRAPIDRLTLTADSLSGYRRAPGRATFFTDANGCVARRAWQAVPFRDVAYAEDQLIACEMLEAGWAKVFQPQAAVLHSHEYGTVSVLRRCFDEWRGLREVHGYIEPLSARRHLHRVRREVRGDRALLKQSGESAPARFRGGVRSTAYHVARALGSVLGSRADRLPPRARALLSLERRPGFSAVPPPRPIVLGRRPERAQPLDSTSGGG